METTALATQNAELVAISPEVAAYLAEIDKLNVKRSGIMTPIISCMRSVKDSENYGIPLGNYFSKKKGENDKYVYTNRGREMKLIILRIASQYSYFDGISDTMVMQTTEFGPGVGDTLVCTDEDKNIVFEGNSKDFKAWALKNHPKHDANPQYPSSMFKYSTVLYVADINETEVGTPKGVYKLSLPTTNNDYLWKYQNSCSGFPIRYLTTFTPEAMDKGSNRWYVSKMEIDEEVPADVLVQMIKLKQELDGYLNFAVQNLKAPKVDDAELEDVIVEEVITTVAPTPAVQPTPVVSVTPTTTTPSETAKTTEQALKDAEDVFG